MGLVFEVIFLFVAINYLIIEFIKSKVADAEYKSRLAEAAAQREAINARKEAAFAETEARRRIAKDVEGVVVNNTLRRTYNRDIERECVEVLKTLSSWQDIVEWNVSSNLARYDSYAKTAQKSKTDKEKERAALARWTHDISAIIYFANRGKLPDSLLGFYPGEFSWLFHCQGYELMVWWREKLRSFGFRHELWCCYSDWIDSKSYWRGKRRFLVDNTTGVDTAGAKYYWDTEYEELSHYTPIR